MVYLVASYNLQPGQLKFNGLRLGGLVNSACDLFIAVILALARCSEHIVNIFSTSALCLAWPVGPK